MNTERNLSVGGALSLRVIRNLSPEAVERLPVRHAPLSWKLRNIARWPFVRGFISVKLIAPFANLWGICTLTSELSIKLIKGDTGEVIDYGVVAYRVITDTGVTYLRDDFNNNAQDITNMNYHGLGTGGGAEAAGNTALTTESTTALNPDSTRATGTRSTPASNQFRTVGTLTFDADAAVIEHGIFSQAATGGGTLWDRSTFAAINVVGANGDSIQATYTLSLTSGG